MQACGTADSATPTRHIILCHGYVVMDCTIVALTGLSRTSSALAPWTRPSIRRLLPAARPPPNSPCTFE